jgi:hypothetical protein
MDPKACGYRRGKAGQPVLIHNWERRSADDELSSTVSSYLLCLWRNGLTVRGSDESLSTGASWRFYQLAKLSQGWMQI